MPIIKAFFISLGVYTRFPLKFKNFDDVPPQRLLINLISVGAIIGILWKLLYDLLFYFELPAIALAPILMIFPFWLSGYLHLEAFMESSARIYSQKLGYDKSETRGIFGVVALAVLFIFGFSGAYQFTGAGNPSALLIFIPLFSRELTVLMIFLFPALSGNEYESQMHPRKGENTLSLMIIFVVTVVLCITLTGIKGSVLITAMLFAFLVSAISAKASVGITGDTAGYALTISETAGLFALAVFKL